MPRPPSPDAEKPEDRDGDADDGDEQAETDAQHEIRADERIEARAQWRLGSGSIHGRQFSLIGYTDILRANARCR